MTKLKWSTEKRLVKELIPYENNPRKMTKDQVDQLTKSLKKFDLVEIPVINTDNKIIAGHQRLKIMAALGMVDDLIDVRVPNRLLTDKEYEEYNIRSNKNTGEWDWDILGNVFDKDDLVEWGFNELELGLMTLTEDGFEEKDVIDDGKPAVSKEGDLWTLGNHRLLCGDSTKKEDFEKLMQGDKAQLIFTDPPYNVNYKFPGGLDYNSKKFGGTGGKIFNDDKTDADCLVFYTECLNRLYENSKDSAMLYWWFANVNAKINHDAWGMSKWHFSQIIIWLKNAMVFSMGCDYHRQYEPCMVGWKEGKTHYTNKKLANYKDVFSLDKEEFANILDVWYEHRDLTTEYVHPTQKPVRLSERAIMKNSKPGDIVLDAFGGSGSTLIGCEQAGRHARVMELDPKYCDAILTRFSLTGKEPIRSDGKKWSEINNK